MYYQKEYTEGEDLKQIITQVDILIFQETRSAMHVISQGYTYSVDA